MLQVIDVLHPGRPNVPKVCSLEIGQYFLCVHLGKEAPGQDHQDMVMPRLLALLPHN